MFIFAFRRKQPEPPRKPQMADMDARWDNQRGMMVRLAGGPYRSTTMELLIRSASARANVRNELVRRTIRERKKNQ